MKISPPSRVIGVTAAQVSALIPPLILMTIVAGIDIAGQLIAAVTTVLIWEWVFAFARKQALGFHGVTTALIVVVFVPTDLPLWQLVLALSLGCVLAELIFGGRGFGFLSPATVALALLAFSFPQVQLTAGTLPLALATVPGAAWLLFLGLISWRVVLGVALAIIAMMALNGHDIDPAALVAALTFSTIFLICDPTAAASTNPGRWVYGFLAASLVFLFSQGPFISAQAVVFASLTASIFAPLIDHLVVLAHRRRRKRWANA